VILRDHFVKQPHGSAFLDVLCRHLGSGVHRTAQRHMLAQEEATLETKLESANIPTRLLSVLRKLHACAGDGAGPALHAPLAVRTNASSASSTPAPLSSPSAEPTRSATPPVSPVSTGFVAAASPAPLAVGTKRNAAASAAPAAGAKAMQGHAPGSGSSSLLTPCRSELMLTVKKMSGAAGQDSSKLPPGVFAEVGDAARAYAAIESLGRLVRVGDLVHFTGEVDKLCMCDQPLPGTDSSVVHYVNVKQTPSQGCLVTVEWPFDTKVHASDLNASTGTVLRLSTSGEFRFYVRMEERVINGKRELRPIVLHAARVVQSGAGVVKSPPPGALPGPALPSVLGANGNSGGIMLFDPTLSAVLKVDAPVLDETLQREYKSLRTGSKSSMQGNELLDVSALMKRLELEGDDRTDSKEKSLTGFVKALNAMWNSAPGTVAFGVREEIVTYKQLEDNKEQLYWKKRCCIDEPLLLTQVERDSINATIHATLRQFQCLDHRSGELRVPEDLVRVEWIAVAGVESVNQEDGSLRQPYRFNVHTSPRVGLQYTTLMYYKHANEDYVYHRALMADGPESIRMPIAALQDRLREDQRRRMPKPTAQHSAHMSLPLHDELLLREHVSLRGAMHAAAQMSAQHI
jgi:hypothetical protein